MLELRVIPEAVMPSVRIDPITGTLRGLESKTIESTSSVTPVITILKIPSLYPIASIAVAVVDILFEAMLLQTPNVHSVRLAILALVFPNCHGK